MFCLRKGVKSPKDSETGNTKFFEQNLADSNASFLRAARAGNLDKVLEFLKGNIDINTSNANGLNALHLAAKEGHVNVVTELLKKGANVNAATKKGNTALHIASLAGQQEVVKVLANLGANVNVQSQNGFTPLYMAAQENHDTVVSFLLSNGANQSLATEDGFTPLAVALQQGHDKVVAVLLENDTKGRVRLPALHIASKKDDCKAATLLLQNDHNPDVTSKSGFTPLHIAAHYGNSKIANILLNKGADVNYAAKHQITPLHVASKWGKSNMAELLIEKGAKIDAVTRDGLTPLHCAARSGHDQVVDLLLENGAPILAKTKNGLAPLHMSSQGDHVDSARILLYHKAPVDDVTVDYLTALHVAAHCGHVKVAKLLLDRKADPNARALNGFTPLHIACKKNRIKVVELLLKHGASIEATTESGLSPLHVASFMGCMNIVIYLIQSGANPDVSTVRGETPLHLAARANQIDIIRILLRNGANVDARAREEQTPLHIAARLGNVDIVSLLLQHGAAVDAITKDMYTALHIASKEGQEEVVSVLLDHEASLTSVTKRGFTPLHLAAKYRNIKVIRLLLQKDAPIDAQGKNGLTPLHVAAHYNHVNEALLLLEKGASPHAIAKNGFTPLHIAAKKNQMDIATTLLEYGAKCNAESKAAYTPLHLSSQEGHTDITTLLIEHQANVNMKAANGLTPLHLCAQEDRVNVASILVKNGSEISPQTLSGYTPLHVASHFGQINMVRFLLQNNAIIQSTTEYGYTPLHQAAQQGHAPVVNVLLENKASPNATTVNGQTALSIAQKLGYISVVETLKVVTETIVTTTTTTVTEEKYKVVAPEIMQETFMTDSEDEGGEDTMLGDQSYRYLTADEMKSLGDDSLPIDVTKDERQHDAIEMIKDSTAPMVEEDKISPQHITPIELEFSEKFSPDNIDISRAPVHAGFLVSFMVDARGGAMRGCRHSGVRVIIPPRKASMPMRITCRYLRREKLTHPPPLMEGEACASRILEVGPVGARFLGPVILEVPHFASLRGREREVTILRSDTGETWREHSLEASEEAVQDVLNESFEGEEMNALEDLNTNRITRILTTDFPQYFAIVTRIRQEVHGVGPEGGIVSSKVVPQVQAIFPEGALQKKIRVGLQAQPLSPELVAKLLGNRVAVSPIVTVEPRRRKFHKPITLTIPVPQAATKGMINQYSGDAPTLRLLCSITGSTKSGGSSKAQWEDVTGSTPLTFVNDCVSFTTTVSARFWLMDCRQVNEVSKLATELYQEAVHVPFMAKFVIFAKRHDPNEAQLRVFCMTDDKEDKTLETQEHFTEIAKSRDVEVFEGKLQHLEFAGNLVPVTNSKEQLKFMFHAFHENRLPFIIRIKDPHVEPLGRVAFMRETKVGRGEPPQTPICNLNIAMPEISLLEQLPAILELVTLEKTHDFMQEAGLSKPEAIHRANLRLSDIARELDKDWVVLANELGVRDVDINTIKSRFSESEQALEMLRIWLRRSGSKMSGNDLEKALTKINAKHIINKCMFNVELVTDDVEKAVAKVHLDQSEFDIFKEELGSSREASMRRGVSMDISYDEQDIMKEAESAAETSSETGSLFEKDQISQYLPEEVVHPSGDHTIAQNSLTMKTWSEAQSDQRASKTFKVAINDDMKVLDNCKDNDFHEMCIDDINVSINSPLIEPMKQVITNKSTNDQFKMEVENENKGNTYKQDENQDKPNFGIKDDCSWGQRLDYVCIDQEYVLQECEAMKIKDTDYKRNVRPTAPEVLFEATSENFDSSSVKTQDEFTSLISERTQEETKNVTSDTIFELEEREMFQAIVQTQTQCIDNESVSLPVMLQNLSANDCAENLQSNINDYDMQTHMTEIGYDGPKDVGMLQDNLSHETEISDNNFASNTDINTSFIEDFDDKLGSEVICTSENQSLKCTNTCPIENNMSQEFQLYTSCNTPDNAPILPHSAESSEEFAAKKSDIVNEDAVDLILDKIDSEILNGHKISSAIADKENLQEEIAHKGLLPQESENIDVMSCMSYQKTQEMDLPKTITNAEVFKTSPESETSQSNYIQSATINPNFPSIESTVSSSENSHMSDSDGVVYKMVCEEDMGKHPNIINENDAKIDSSEAEQFITYSKADEINPYNSTVEKSIPYNPEDKTCKSTTDLSLANRTSNQEHPKIVESENKTTAVVDNSPVPVSDCKVDELAKPLIATISNKKDETDQEQLQEMEGSEKIDENGANLATIQNKSLNIVTGQTESSTSIEGSTTDASVIEQCTHILTVDDPIDLKYISSISKESVDVATEDQGTEVIPENALTVKKFTKSSEDHSKIKDISEECLEISYARDSITKENTSAEPSFEEKEEQQVLKGGNLSGNLNLVSMAEEREFHEMIVSQNLDEHLIDANIADDADRWSTHTEGSVSDDEPELPLMESSKINIYSDEISCSRKIPDMELMDDTDEPINVKEDILHVETNYEKHLLKDIEEEPKDSQMDKSTLVSVKEEHVQIKILPEKSSSLVDNYNLNSKEKASMLEEDISINIPIKADVKNDTCMPILCSQYKQDGIETDTETGPFICDPKVSKTVVVNRFIPLAFDNTAFVGAEAIDASELHASCRARSPYEVVRDEHSMNEFLLKDASSQIKSETHDTHSFCNVVGQDTNVPGYRTAEVQSIFSRTFDDNRLYMRRHILQQIPSEISEEDLIESDVSTPSSRCDASHPPSTKEIELSEGHAGVIITGQPLAQHVISKGDYLFQSNTKEEMSCLENVASLEQLQRSTNDEPDCAKSSSQKEHEIKKRYIKNEKSITLQSHNENILDFETALLESPFQLSSKKQIISNEVKINGADMPLTDNINTDMNDSCSPSTGNISQEENKLFSNYEFKSQETCFESALLLHDNKAEHMDIYDRDLNKTYMLESGFGSAKIEASCENERKNEISDQSLSFNTEFLTEQSSDVDQVYTYMNIADDKQLNSTLIMSMEGKVAGMKNDDISTEDKVENPEVTEPTFDSKLFNENLKEKKFDCKRKTVLKGVEDMPIEEQKSLHIADSQDISVERLHYGSTSDCELDVSIQSDLCANESACEDGNIIEHEKSGLRKMGSFKDVSTVHLHIDEPRELDIGFSALAVTKSTPDNSDFNYGMQFEKEFDDVSEEAMEIDSDQFEDEKEIVYAYGMRFEREHDMEEEISSYGDLYTHHEEDEEAIEDIDKLKDTTSIKAEFDILAGRKFFTKSGELDNVSMSSLQEFERLEEEIRSDRRLSLGSIDSLNGKHIPSKCLDHDDISMNSLTEFEKLEKECSEAEGIEVFEKETIARLSEIEEGHESQASETSQETSEAGRNEYKVVYKEYDVKLKEYRDIMCHTKSNCREPSSPSSINATKKMVTHHHEIIGCDMPQGDLDITKQIGPQDVLNLNHGLSENMLAECGKVEKNIMNSGDYVALDQRMNLYARNGKCEDLDQDSLHDEKSIKPDSLSAEDKWDFQDSLHDDKSGDLDSLQDVKDEMHDSLHDEKLIDEDSLHEMDILPDESSLSLESSLAAVIDVSHDSLCEKVFVQQNNTEQDFDTDSLKGISFATAFETAIASQGFEVTAMDIAGYKNDMISSTDSLDRSSSAVTHTTYQYETESLMSSSLNSVPTTDDCTMISSVEALEFQTPLSINDSSPDTNASKSEIENAFVDSEGNVHFQECKSFIQMEKEFHSLIKLNEKSELHHSNIAEVHTYNTSPKLSDKNVIHHDKQGLDANLRYFKEIDSTFKELSSSKGMNELKTTDEYGNIATFKKLGPVLHSTSSEICSNNFVVGVQCSETTKDREKYKNIDEDGNIIKVCTNIIGEHSAKTFTATGPDTLKQKEEFMKHYHSRSGDISHSSDAELHCFPKSSSSDNSKRNGLHQAMKGQSSQEILLESTKYEMGAFVRIGETEHVTEVIEDLKLKLPDKDHQTEDS